MGIVYLCVCSVDMHILFIVAIICISEFIKPLYLKKRFSTFRNDLIRFRPNLSITMPKCMHGIHW